MNKFCAYALATPIAALWASTAMCQSMPEKSGGSQTHLDAARALAAEDNSWRHPALVTCYPNDGGPSQSVNKDPGGYKIFDNVYYVGHGKTGPYAIDTSAGIILVDAMNNQSDVDNVIIPNMRAVGLDPSRIKILIISHGHGDHFGGAQYIVDKYHPALYMSAIDYDFAAKSVRPAPAGAPVRPNAFGPPPKRDQVITDGGTISLGGESIKTYITPGHTPGSIMMLIPTTLNGQPHLLAYIGGATNKGLSPEMHTAFTESSARMVGVFESAKPDGLIAAHPNYDDAVYNIEYMKANPKAPNPFLIGTDRIVRFLNILKECNLNNAEVELRHPRHSGE